MNIQKSFKAIPGKLSGVMEKHPVELGLFCYIFVILSLDRENAISNPAYMILAPLFIVMAYVFNNLFISGKRYLYYLCWIPLVPLSFLDIWKEWSDTSQFIITLGVLSPLAVLLCRRKKDNGSFIEEILKYIYSGSVSLLMSAITQGLFLAIFFSIVYIFKIMEAPQLQSAVVEYSAMVSYILLFPVIFFAVLDRAFETDIDIKGTRITDALLNYIVTPALLIYTGILYIYFIKIIAVWELPEGGIAYLVFGFTIIAIIVKALQTFVLQRRYDWYFEKFSLISVPAIIMFWIGTIRRVTEYGLTEWRVYLIVCGAVMTSCIIMFSGKRFAYYSYVCILAFALFAGTAYIPYFSAERLSVASQENRAGSIANKLGLLNSVNHINTELRPLSDTVYYKEYSKLYSAIEYLQKKDISKLNKLGLNSSDELLQILPKEMEYYVTHGRKERIYRSEDYIYIESDNSGFGLDGIEEYKKLYMPLYSASGIYSQFKDNKLTVFDKDSVIFSIKGSDLVNAGLNNTGYSLNNLPPKSILDSVSGKILLYRTDSLLLKLNRINIYKTENGAEIKNIIVDFLLMK